MNNSAMNLTAFHVKTEPQAAGSIPVVSGKWSSQPIRQKSQSHKTDLPACSRNASSSVSQPENHQRNDQMKPNMIGIAVVSLLAWAIALAPTQGFAQENQKEKPKAAEKQDVPKSQKKAGPIPFHGKLGAVDKIAKTITVGERSFQITSETKLSKGGKPATLDDAVVGEEVGGNYLKGDDGKLTAKTARFGPKPGGEAKKTAGSKKEKP